MSCNSPVPDCQPCQDCPPVGVSYVLPDCPAGEKCESLYHSSCVVYKGPNLPALNVLNNDRISAILVKLHKVVNGLLSGGGFVIQNYTATCTPASGSSTPFKITYLGVEAGVHKVFEKSILPNVPQIISAFPGSVVTISGVGTVIAS